MLIFKGVSCFDLEERLVGGVFFFKKCVMDRKPSDSGRGLCLKGDLKPEREGVNGFKIQVKGMSGLDDLDSTIESLFKLFSGVSQTAKVLFGQVFTIPVSYTTHINPGNDEAVENFIIPDRQIIICSG